MTGRTVAFVAAIVLASACSAGPVTVDPAAVERRPPATPSSTATTAPPSVSATDSPTASTVSTSAPAPPTVPSEQPTVVTPVRPSVGVPPATVTFGALERSAPVVPVGVLASGELQLPDDPTVVGWWAGGAGLGSDAGSIVVAGHVDSHRYGLGTFAVLRDLHVGDPIEVADETGDVYRFAVTGQLQIAKEALPAELFTRDGPMQLVLITCGGEFDEGERHYADNVIVTAQPA